MFSLDNFFIITNYGFIAGYSTMKFFYVNRFYGGKI